MGLGVYGVWCKEENLISPWLGDYKMKSNGLKELVLYFLKVFPSRGSLGQSLNRAIPGVRLAGVMRNWLCYLHLMEFAPDKVQLLNCLAEIWLYMRTYTDPLL